MRIVVEPCHGGHRPSLRQRAWQARSSTPWRRAAGLALLLVAASGPAAARPLPKAEPAPRVRDCPEMGDGFVRLPGSDTCVKLGGSVRVEFMKQGGTDR